MPELPEVETIARYLREGHPGSAIALPGLRIEGVHLLWNRTLFQPTPKELVNNLPGLTFTQVDRRGKYLQLQLTNGVLLAHLRMSGDLFIQPDEIPLPPHTRFWLKLSQGQRLVFNDARKFGRVWWVQEPASVLGRLGPEPLGEMFTPNWLDTALHEHRRQIKPLLLDQSFVAGLGNIYTDEALFLAGIHPNRLSTDVTSAEAVKLHHAIQTVLREGIQQNGASIDWVYRGGDFQNHFRVYQQTGKACPVCNTPIERIVVGQRGTHFCPNCQQ